MTQFRRTVFVLVFVVCAAIATAADKRPITFEDMINLKNVGSATIAPDGSRVLFTVREWEWPGGKVEPDKGAKPPEMRSHVWMVSADGTAPARQITFGDKGESAPAWSPDGTYISFLATRGGASGGGGGTTGADEGPKSQIWLMRADGGEAWQLTEAKEGVGQYVWAPDSKTIAYLMRDSLAKEIEDAHKRKDDAKVFEGDFQMTHIWTIDVASKKPTQITTGHDFTVRSISWSADSTRIAFATVLTPMVRDEREDIAIVTVASKAIEKLSTTPGRRSSPAWSRDGRTIAFAETPSDQKPHADGISPRPLFNSHLMLYDVATKRARDVYNQKQLDASVFGFIWTPDSKRVMFGVGHRVYRDVVVYDLATNRYEVITKDMMAGPGSISKDGTRVAFTMDSPTWPAEVYVTDARYGSPKRLTTINAQVADFALGETDVMTWKSSDGWDVEGILVKPVGYQPGRKYPLLVDVHGGPTGAHSNGFKVGIHNDGQFWAGQGWAVLYPNPRGSAGYGEKFMRGNIPDWGGGDYRDIMAGVDAAIQKGIADPEKLAVMGWSYGGYMTTWIVSQTSRFKAARIGAGLSEMYGMYGTTDIPGYIATFFNGYPTKTTLPLYLERSGITYADKVTTPTLILHGSNDERVPIGQPMEFYRALKDRGKTVELVFYPREGHGFGEYYHQRDQLRREFEWITKYTLGGGNNRPTTQ